MPTSSPAPTPSSEGGDVDTLSRTSSFSHTDPMLNRAAKKRWWYRSSFAALVMLPLPAALAYGCGTPTEYDDLCGWVRDPNNCYRNFFIDVGVSCGAVGTTKIGQFASREKLDLCILNEG